MYSARQWRTVNQPWSKLVSDVEIPYVEVARPLAGGALVVQLQAHCHLVFLMEDGLAAVPLCFDEELCPLHACDHVVTAHEFSLGRAVGVDLLLLLCVDDGASPEGHSPPGVDLHVDVYSEEGIDVPVDDPEDVGFEDQRGQRVALEVVQ